MTYGNAHFCRWLRLCGAVLAALYFTLTPASAFVSGGKTWPDSWSISGEWSHVNVEGLSGSTKWNLIGTAVETSPGVWRYRVSYNVTYKQQRMKNVATTIPNTYKWGSKHYVNVHFSFLPVPSGNQESWAASGVVSSAPNIPAYWDPVPVDGLYGVTGSLVGGTSNTTPSGFSRSIQIGAPKYTYSFINDTDQMRTYEIFDSGGNKIFTKILPPGHSATGSFSDSVVPGGGTGPSAWSGPSGGNGNFDGTSGWAIDVGGYVPTHSFDSTKVGVNPETSKPETVTQLPDQDEPEPPSNVPPNPVNWTRPTNQDESLKDDVFRQGVKGITDRLDQLIKKPSGSGGDTSVEVDVDVSGVESRLDAANDRLEAIRAAAEAQEARINAANTATDSGGRVNGENVDGKAGTMGAAVISAAQSAGNAFGSTAADAMSVAMPSAPAAVNAPTAAVEDFIVLTIRPGQVVNVPKNPLSSAGPFGGVMADVAGFIKKLIAWGIVAAFVIWAHKRIQEMIEKPFDVAPFGTSISDAINSVKIAGFGGGWGIVARGIVGALILPLILTLPLAAVTAFTTGFPWGEVKSAFTAGVGALPSSGMLGKAFWLSDQVIPWVTLLTAPVWYFLTQYVIFPTKLFWMIFMKYVAI